MKIETKFNLGDVVYGISKRTQQVKHTCGACNGLGKVELNGKSFTCPECWGRGHTETTEPMAWRIDTDLFPSKVGRVQATEYAKKYLKNHDRGTTYMVESTGIGSGSIWREESLFSSLEEAQAACDAQNREDNQG
jgi:DnaJ-class molecular chaperone